MAIKAQINRTVVKALKPGETIRDTAITNFEARRRKGVAVAYSLTYRNADGVQRRYTVPGLHTPDAADSARKAVIQVLAEVAKGADPAAGKAARRLAPTVADLCDRYMADALDGSLMTRSRTAKAPSTIGRDRSRLAGHIKPLLGGMRVAAVTSADVSRPLTKCVTVRVR